ncbi:MAG TPA: hypothetical protein VNO32_37245 [Candidatus Acidoferrum sp.]|jgi:hypothetical protein|nr:hypothetical protein [Candidatus Acidoferrum sp.]
MHRRIAGLFLIVALAIGIQGIVAGTASAHSLTVTASASCSNGAAVISYTAISWNPGGTGGSNTEIDILFNGVKVDMQPFSLSTNPPDQFSGQMPTPSATSTVVVEGVASGTWDDSFPNGQTSSVTVTVPNNCAPGTGRFTGGGKQVLVGVATLTKGFEVDCDLTTPSNNMEVNWSDPSGATHHFHMEVFVSAMCTLNGNPTPPKAPVNTIVASGTGRYDGVEGFTLQFTLVDNGEPGTNDQAGFMIFETANPTNVVLSFPVMTITTGNIQAHVDQR